MDLSLLATSRPHCAAAQCAVAAPPRQCGPAQWLVWPSAAAGEENTHASVTNGYSLHHMRLHPPSHTVTGEENTHASVTYDYSLHHMRLQAPSHTVTGEENTHASGGQGVRDRWRRRRTVKVPPLARSKCPPWQRPGSPPVPPQGAPCGFGQLGTPRARPSHWDPSHCLGGSSELPPKSPIPPPFTV